MKLEPTGLLFIGGTLITAFSSAFPANTMEIAVLVGILLSVIGVFGFLFPNLWKKAISHSKFIPLKDASLIAYETMRGTKYGVLVEGLNGDIIGNEMRTNYYAEIFIKDAKVFGQHRPSNKFEQISKEELQTYRLSSDANGLYEVCNGTIIWTELRIEKKHFDNAIKQLKNNP